MRVVVRVDEARQHQVIARVDDFHLRTRMIPDPVARRDARDHRIAWTHIGAARQDTACKQAVSAVKDIAERAAHLARLPAIPVPDALQHMTDLTGAMVRQSLDAFVNLDARILRFCEGAIVLITFFFLTFDSKLAEPWSY